VQGLSKWQHNLQSPLHLQSFQTTGCCQSESSANEVIFFSLPSSHVVDAVEHHNGLATTMLAHLLSQQQRMHA
jgi:hypothetical protein